MLLSPKARVGDFAAKDVKNALRRVCRHYPVDTAFEAVFGKRAREAARECVTAGYLLKQGRKEPLEISRQGVALANARFGKPLSRRLADQRLREVIERAGELNQDTTLPKVVTRLAVFGEYVDESESDIERLDIMVWTDDRLGIPPLDQHRAAYSFAEAKGLRWPSGIGEALMLARSYIFRQLKARRTDIRLTEPPFDERQCEKIPTIFDCKPASLSRWSLSLPEPRARRGAARASP